VNLKRHLLETLTLVAAAVLCALVSNALASRERRLALVGTYPDALKVPPQAATSRALAPDSKSGDAAVAQNASKGKKEPAGGTRPGITAGQPAAASPGASSPFSASSAADLKQRFPPHPDKPWVEVSGDDVALLQASGALVLDARRTNVYEEGHIAGARSVSVWESGADEKVLALLNEGRDLEAPVVVYCSGGDCEDSHMLAQRLFGAGFNNLLVYRDGWPDWQKRRGPSGTGPET
jgi:rhodanese-related sulfurtransferase